MAFDQDTTQLFKELVGGYELTARLQALLGRPLDGRGHEEAVAITRELSRVFMVSLFMLRPDKGMEEARMLEKSGASIGSSAGTKDKCPRRGGATRRELTWSPHADGYQWRKYGQKRISNSNFTRNYYRCAYGRDRHCPARKQVQQQDDIDGNSPMFEVNYVDEHTCHIVANPTSTSRTSYSLEVLDPARNGSLLPHVDSVQENEVIISCLATVINGPCRSNNVSASASLWPAEASLSDHTAHVAGVPPRGLDGDVRDEMVMDPSFPYEQSVSDLVVARLNAGDVSMVPTWLRRI